jgi:hypothetical protein
MTTKHQVPLVGVDDIEKELAKLPGNLDRIAALKDALAASEGKRRVVLIESRCKGNTLKFGLCGDTQFGSLYEFLPGLRGFYALCQKEGISHILHTGDVLDGWKMYKGQEFELHRIGWQQQRDWFCKQAPEIKGITTHFITGNHDASFKKLAGVDVGVALEELRPDWKFLGEDMGNVEFPLANGRSCRVMLVHPDGGTAYAQSYHVQKMIESLAGGDKPHILCVGHYHKSDLMPTYRNIAAFQSGTFQKQTGYMKRKRLAAQVGGWIVEFTPGADSDLYNRIRAEFVAFY